MSDLDPAFKESEQSLWVCAFDVEFTQIAHDMDSDSGVTRREAFERLIGVIGTVSARLGRALWMRNRATRKDCEKHTDQVLSLMRELALEDLD